MLMKRAKLLGKLNQIEEFSANESRINKLIQGNSRAEIQVSSYLAKCKKIDDSCFSGSTRRIENYAQWQLENLTIVSKHSAIYHFTSKDRMRATPNARGRGRTVWPKTWHTTLLANVGANAEGPLSWIERDYTPISCAKDWESGKCDILIKIYGTGLATSWLHKEPLGSSVWLSKPMKTLDVPSLVPDLQKAAFKPASYLLVLAGSGIVAAPQVLHHAKQGTCFGSFPVLTSKVSLIYSCRSDDVCLAAELMDWCKDGSLQRCSMVVTDAQQGVELPFPQAPDADLTELASLANAAVFRSRLSPELLSAELSSLKAPCRIVVSGPASFNAAAQEMLSQIGVGRESITVLAA
jgi:ferredoxin-NADP reductase